MLEGRTQPTRAYILYTTYLFRTIFYLINYSLRDPHYICPQIFLFSRPHFATTIRDPISRLHSRLTFATHVHDSRSRLMFVTPLATHIRNSHSRLTFATPDRTPSRDSLFISQLPPLTDGLC